MKRISTHILDLTLGKPASNVLVHLDKQDTSGWHPLASLRTDADGRCPQLLPEAEELSPGNYRLSFDTATYFATLETTALYPAVEVTFQVRDGETQIHIPLLLSPNGYTTYRGS